MRRDQERRRVGDKKREERKKREQRGKIKRRKAEDRHSYLRGEELEQRSDNFWPYSHHKWYGRFGKQSTVLRGLIFGRF